MSPRDRPGTVRALLTAGATVFARQGLNAATVDDIAAAAGLTKGAVYSNFGSKTDLFLAVMQDRYAERIDAIRTLTNDPDPDTVDAHARALALEFAGSLQADPEWPILFFEACTHALRNDEFRTRFARHNADLRAALADLIDQRLREANITTAPPPHQIAAMSTILANGFALERQLDPETVDHEMLVLLNTVFLRGLTSP